MVTAYTKEQFLDNRNIFTELDELIYKQTKLNYISEAIYETNKDKESTKEKVKKVMQENKNPLSLFTSIRKSNFYLAERYEIKVSKVGLEGIIKEVKNKNSKLSFEEVRFYHYMYGINTDPNQRLVYTYLRNNIGRQNSLNQLQLDRLIINEEIIYELKNYIKSFKEPLGNMSESQFDKHLEIIINVGNKIRELQNHIDNSYIRLETRELISS